MTNGADPIARLDRKKIRAVFSDFDHTLTEENGSIAASTVHALERLKAADYFLTLVSGCSAGTADALIRLLPVDTVVFENGAGLYIRRKRGIETKWLAQPDKLDQDRKYLEAAWEKIRTAVPRAQLARGHEFRLFDYAVNYNEQSVVLSAGEVQQVIEVLKHTPRIQFRQSSIHINYWIGDHNKQTACQWLIKENPEITVDNTVYCGDSPNDEPLFELFKNSVGVRNVMPFLEAMYFKPRFIADAPYGAGFCEVVNHLLTP